MLYGNSAFFNLHDKDLKGNLIVEMLYFPLLIITVFRQMENCDYTCRLDNIVVPAGPSGSGKTSLLSAILKEMLQTSGT